MKLVLLLQIVGAFMVGAVIPICRPGQQQRILYNGNNRIHSTNVQSVVIPNGLIANLSGPTMGNGMTVACWQNAGLLTNVEHYSYFPMRN